MNKMKHFVAGLVSVLVLLSTMTAHADQATTSAVKDPVALVQNTADQMISDLKAQGGNLEGNTNVVANIVRKRLLPMVDVSGMSRFAVGSRSWNAATPQQQKEFTDEFVNLVINTYSTALSEYSDETVKVYPIRGGYAGKDLIQVHSVINRQNGPSIPVDYKLARFGETWKLYDFAVDNVSMIQSFRSQFSSILAQSGMTGLIDTLRNHNSKQTS